MYNFTKKIFDFILSFFLIIIFFPICILICFAILIIDKQFPIYISKRVGKKNIIFNMPKFRTMKFHTPQLATNKLKNPKKYLTKTGPFLRKSSLDELPQLFCVLTGYMSFVGPRPALYNQKNLIKLRKSKKIHELKPGITGLAQINGRDALSIKKKVFFDQIYLVKKNFLFDIEILIKTILVLFKIKFIKH